MNAMKNSHIFSHLDSINIRSNETAFFSRNTNILLSFFSYKRHITRRKTICHEQRFFFTLPHFEHDYLQDKDRWKWENEKKIYEILFALRINEYYIMETSVRCAHIKSSVRSCCCDSDNSNTVHPFMFIYLYIFLAWFYVYTLQFFFSQTHNSTNAPATPTTIIANDTSHDRSF